MADKTGMIDTTLLIDYFRKSDKANSRLVRLSERFDHLVISAVTEFEIYSGATEAQLIFWMELLSEISVLPFDSQAAHIAVEIQRDLKRLRKTIEKPDLFIAATAVAKGFTLDTLNTKHFDNIKRLRLLEDQSAG